MEASHRADTCAQRHASVLEACGKAVRHLARQTVRKAHTGKRQRGGVGTQRGPSSAKAPAGPRQWRWKWALRVWSQVCRTMVAPSWPPRVCWPNWRSVWRTVRNRRVSRRRLLAKLRGWRACGTVNPVWKEGVGRHAARCAATHWAVAPGCHVGQWRLRHALYT